MFLEFKITESSNDAAGQGPSCIQSLPFELQADETATLSQQTPKLAELRDCDFQIFGDGGMYANPLFVCLHDALEA